MASSSYFSMASSFNYSSCQLKCFHSPCRQLKYSSSSSSHSKYSFSPSRQFKYSSSPSCELKDSSSPSPQWEYHVFLSFRFETRHNFTTQLLQALKGKGMNVFFDEQKLEKGKGFLPAISKAIELSKLSIIILSAKYARSDICLTELSNIMDRKRNQQHMVLPIFYGVNRSDVQNIRGDFKEYFKGHESNEEISPDEVQRWIAAFAEVGKLEEGIHIKGDEDDIPETEHIKRIVEYAIHKLRKHQVFLSFGEDTRLNFTSHLLKALEDNGINVSSGQGEQFSQASDLSIIVLSKGYVSSEYCSAQLFDIMELKRTQNHIVLPIFYDVKTSALQEHRKSQGKEHFAEVAGLQGFPIRDTSDRHDYEHIEDVVQWVIQELNRKSRRVSDDLVGIDDQKETILRLIEQKDSRIIGLWGASGIGKTTLAEAVYNEISPTFESRCYFLHDVRGEIERQGKNSLRDKLLSELLKSETCIDTPAIGSTFIRERLKNMKVLVVLDNVSDFDQISFMGVEYFGEGSKIIVTSTDRQVLKNGGADKIHEVNKLNEEDSLQLFSTFAFKSSNPPPRFRDVSYKFLKHAEGIPFNIITYGLVIHGKSIKECESELDVLNQYPNEKIFRSFMGYFDGLDELERNIFLDMACFLKGESKIQVEEILSCLYNKGAVSRISNLVNKSLLHIDSYGRISMHDIRQDMGKFIVRQKGSEDPEKYTRLWSFKDVNQVLIYNKVNKSIKGIKLHMSMGEDLQLFSSSGFKNMLNLRYIDFRTMYLLNNEKLVEDRIDSGSLPSQLRYLCWMFYPYNCLSPSFNPKNLVVLKLIDSNVEQLWNEDYQDLVNLKAIDLRNCVRLRKIPNLQGAINLQSLICRGSDSLVDLSYLSRLTSLENLDLAHCSNLRKIPNLSGAINLKILVCCACQSLVELSELPNSITKLDLSVTGIEQVADSIQHLVGLRELSLSYSRVENVSSNISKFESLRELNLINCKRLKTLQELPRYLWCLDASYCTSLEKVSFTDHNFNSFHSLHDGDGGAHTENISMLFSNCRSLNQDSIKNITANAMLQIQSLARRWVGRKVMSREEHKWDSFLCCFPGNEVSANEFEHRSENSRLNLKIRPMGSRKNKFLAFCICLVADLTPVGRDVAFIGRYQLTSASGEKLTAVCLVHENLHRALSCNGDHVFILFSKHVIRIDSDYEEASFEFHAENDNGEEFKVEKCGVHVFYVDAESYTISDVGM